MSLPPQHLVPLLFAPPSKVVNLRNPCSTVILPISSNWLSLLSLVSRLLLPGFLICQIPCMEDPTCLSCTSSQAQFTQCWSTCVGEFICTSCTSSTSHRPIKTHRPASQARMEGQWPPKSLQLQRNLTLQPHYLTNQLTTQSLICLVHATSRPTSQVRIEGQ